MSEAETFFTRGWIAFPPEPRLSNWAAAARDVAEDVLADPGARPDDLRCDGTWFAGVNALANDATGAVPARGVPPLSGRAIDFIAEVLGLSGFAWDSAQLSVCYPGYPRQGAEESAANHSYRLRRDAAHVDGLLRDPARRRNLGETHGFILGLPLVETPADAAPFVIWEGSHEVMRRAFRARLGALAPRDWPRENITEAYHAARTEAFETCPRREITAPPGGAYLVHRLALHGVAPWRADATAPPRIIAYFRPDPFPGAAPDWWLNRA